MLKRVPYLLIVWAVATTLGCGGEGQPDGVEAASATGDSAAFAWHDSVLAAMGGEDSWERTRYIRFRWNVVRNGQVISDRRHRWDRYTGDYRLETATPQGDSLVALFNVGTKEGRVWIDGEPVTEARADSLVEHAYAVFINDSYWLLMPYKWRDPGVNLEYEGAKTDGDGTWHVIHLSFRDVGLTPGDRYWAYVSAEPPHLMRKWQYHLEGRQESGPMIEWENWQSFGPIRLATERTPREGTFRILFREVVASEDVPPGVFEPPRADA